MFEGTEVAYRFGSFAGQNRKKAIMKKMFMKEIKWIGRLLIYLAGIVTVSLGIVLCKKCNLGISPVSSIPFVLEDVTGLSFGTLTMLFHFTNTALHLVLVKKLWDVKILLQIPIAFLFGIVIDAMQRLVNFDGTVLGYQWIALICSVFFTALGMVCMISMNLVQNPPDGLVSQISRKTGRELGKVKIGYDIACVLASALLGMVFLKRVKGIGVATIVSAFFVGKTVTWMFRHIRDAVRKFMQEETF